MQNGYLALVELGHDLVGSMVPDPLHEFELGEWKKLLTHLIRMVHTMGLERVQTMNER